MEITRQRFQHLMSKFKDSISPLANIFKISTNIFTINATVSITVEKQKKTRAHGTDDIYINNARNNKI